MVKLSIYRRKNPPKGQYRTRDGVVTFLIAFAALASVHNAYQDEVNSLSRQAASTVQEYAKDVEPVSSQQGPRCSLSHTSKVSSSSIVIDKQAIQAQSNDKLHAVKCYTGPDYEKYMTDVAGKEHYTLLHWLTSVHHSKNDCRHVVDIGTRYVTSALALGATGAVPVKTFDLPDSLERTTAFRGKSELQWQQELQESTDGAVQIQFYNLNLLQVPDNDFRDYMFTWLIVLDTFHKPNSRPFEREFLSRIVGMEPKFEGVMVLDDINFNPEMRQWWQELQNNADKWGFKAYDLTSIGHSSGTALLDFSGKVVIKE